MSSIIVHVQAYSTVRVKTFYENKSVYTHTHIIANYSHVAACRQAPVLSAVTINNKQSYTHRSHLHLHSSTVRT